MKFMTGEKKLPSKEAMLKETNDEMETRWAKGYKKRQAHMMGPVQVRYFNLIKFIQYHCFVLIYTYEFFIL